MNEFAERIERDFPVRRKEKEKVDFRTWLVYTLKELGYSPKLESGTSALSAGGNVTNVVVGDIEKAKIVLAAHYDTGVREVLPPLICPTRPATYMLYEALMPLLALAVSFLISFGVTFALNMPNMTLPLFLLLLVVTLFYPKYGKSETNNKNANTSGVIALLEVAKALTPRYRGEVCFLFLDGGTQGSKGAKRLIHAHPELKKKMCGRDALESQQCSQQLSSKGKSLLQQCPCRFRRPRRLVPSSSKPCSMQGSIPEWAVQRPSGPVPADKAMSEKSRLRRPRHLSHHHDQNTGIDRKKTGEKAVPAFDLRAQLPGNFKQWFPQEDPTPTAQTGSHQL